MRAAFVALCMPVAGCAPPTDTVEITFVAEFDGRPIACDTDADVRLTDLRFFVSEPQLRATSGEWVPIRLVEQGRWQQPDLALIDLEDGTANCANGTPGANGVLRGTVPAGDYAGLSFTVGVPFDRNHADPLAAHPPLDDSTMHWHWRSGYKFLRAGVQTDDDGFWVHLGSAGCEGTVQNVTGCRFPNRFAVSIADFEPGVTVAIDVAEFASATGLDDGESSDCSSGPAEEACGRVFPLFGLDFASGETTGEQRLFQIASSKPTTP